MSSHSQQSQSQNEQSGDCEDDEPARYTSNFGDMDLSDLDVDVRLVVK